MHEFPTKVTCIHGPNGCGKTNLLDAIYSLCYTKSYFSRKDALMVQHGLRGMSLAGLTDHHEAKIIIRETGKKELQLNGEEVKQVQQYIGHMSCVMIAPDDVALITETSEERRKFIDSILTLTVPGYIILLSNYNKLLQQRNALLKAWHGTNNAQGIIAYYNTNMSVLAHQIFTHRKAVVGQLVAAAVPLYENLGESKEIIELKYISSLFYNALDIDFEKNLNKDIAVQRTTAGIHRDDLLVTWGSGESFKETASQGQKKTMLFALKLAQFQILKSTLPKVPILLLDDVFEKLDQERSTKLLQFILEEDAQTLITDTHLDRLQLAFGASEQVSYIKLQGR
jgi:DNA replication and repair protein RecF